VFVRRRDDAKWEGRTSGSFVAACAEHIPEQMAIVDGDRTIDYGELRDLVGRVGAALQRLGVGRGDVVTFQLPNWWEASVLYHAITWIGAVANPVVPIYRERELRFILQQARPRLLVLPESFRGHDYAAMATTLTAELETAHRPEVVLVRTHEQGASQYRSFDHLVTHDGAGAPPVDDPDAICLLLYTSGTTADPKGALHSHQTLVYEARSIVRWFELGASDRVFMPSPVTHITGVLYGILTPPMTGTFCVLQEVWDPATAVDLIEEHECRFMVGATPFLQGLVDEYAARARASAIRVFGCGGADVPPELIRRARAVLDACVVRMYGSTEFPTSCSGGLDDPVEIAADTDGLPIGPVEHLIDGPDADGVGELLLRGPELFLGYLDSSLNDDAFTPDGFFRTGDFASIAAATGAVTIHGRKKDIIIRGGENISAKEIEDLLYEHPSVQEVAVVAMPDARMGEKVCAVVVPSGDPPTLDEFVSYLGRKQLAKQKLPERLELVAELPKTASGKVQKFVLRDLVARNTAAECSQ
jgi:cyclohexanecarboxylate-CoA ligase